MAQMACGYKQGKPVAVSNHTARYRTWIHAAYEVGYAGVSKTLCGRRFYDPGFEGEGWQSVSCEKCQRAISKLAKAQPAPAPGAFSLDTVTCPECRVSVPRGQESVHEHVR